MHELLKTAVLTALVSGGLVAGVPLMFTALGEAISERAGVLNIGLEGMMLFGAYAGFVGAYYGHSSWLGYLAGMAGGTFIALFMVILCVWLGLDQIVVGIALTIGAEGATSTLHSAQFANTRPLLGSFASVSIPGLSEIPVLGPSLFTQPLIVYLGFGLVALVAWTFRHTNLGLNLLAAGEKPEALDAAGVSVFATRSFAALSAGALAGLGGAYLSIIGAGVFVPFMTHGQGFMGIVLAMLARGRPMWVVVGAFLFGMSLSLTTALQLAGINVPIDYVNMLPFVAVMVTLIVFARRSFLPPALALPYVRGAR
jgi:general nucleoside transport system permease protein